MKASEVLARNVKAARAQRGMSQEDLAQAMTRLGHDWTAGTVASVEVPRRRVNVDELAALALALGYPFPELLVPVPGERLTVGKLVGMSAGSVRLWATGVEYMQARWNAEGKPLPPLSIQRDQEHVDIEGETGDEDRP